MYSVVLPQGFDNNKVCGFFYIALWIYCVFSICGDYICRSIQVLNSFPSINKAPPHLISHLFFVYCYYAPISPISPIFLSFSFLLNIFWREACCKYLQQPSTFVNRRKLWRPLSTSSIGGDLLWYFCVCIVY